MANEPKEPTYPEYSGHQDFFLKSPLYERRLMTAPQIEAFLSKVFKFDGHCPYCRRSTTFTRKNGSIIHLGTYTMSDLQKVERIGNVQFVCARNSGHELHFQYYLDESVVQKIGQFPSFADVAIDESKEYSKLLDKQDVAEFHKAIGLAAHGVGIGSYVYLRRIFERIIFNRFAQYKDIEGWDEAAFKGLRMKEKIDLLAKHLPEFLVKNSKIYSILSLGIHELDEKDCLSFFPVLRQSAIWILEQDKKKQEELVQQRELEQAIARFNPPPG
jgi:hypothetical protein